MEPVEFPGTIPPLAGNKDDAVKETEYHSEDTKKWFFLMNGSRLDMRRIRVRVACSQTKWRTWKTYHGIKKEVFNAEIYVISKDLSIGLKGEQRDWGRVS